MPRTKRIALMPHRRIRTSRAFSPPTAQPERRLSRTTMRGAAGSWPVQWGSSGLRGAITRSAGTELGRGRSVHKDDPAATKVAPYNLKPAGRCDHPVFAMPFVMTYPAGTDCGRSAGSVDVGGRRRSGRVISGGLRAAEERSRSSRRRPDRHRPGSSRCNSSPRPAVHRECRPATSARSGISC